MSSCRKKLPVHGNSNKKLSFKKLLNTLNIIKVVTQNESNIYLKETKEIFRGVFFQILCYQTEIEHINENKVDSTGSVF